MARYQGRSMWVRQVGLNLVDWVELVGTPWAESEQPRLLEDWRPRPSLRHSWCRSAGLPPLERHSAGRIVLVVVPLFLTPFTEKGQDSQRTRLWSITGSNGLVCLCMPQPVVCVSSATEKSVNQILKSIEACPLPPGSCDKKSNVHEVLFWGMRKVAVPVLPVAPAANETGRVVLISLAVCPPALTFK